MKYLPFLYFFFLYMYTNNPCHFFANKISQKRKIKKSMTYQIHNIYTFDNEYETLLNLSNHDTLSIQINDENNNDNCITTISPNQSRGDPLT